MDDMVMPGNVVCKQDAGTRMQIRPVENGQEIYRKQKVSCVLLLVRPDMTSCRVAKDCSDSQARLSDEHIQIYSDLRDV